MKYKNKSYKIPSDKLNELISTFESGERIISMCMESPNSVSSQLIIVTEVPDNSITNLLLEETKKRVRGDK